MDRQPGRAAVSGLIRSPISLGYRVNDVARRPGQRARARSNWFDLLESRCLLAADPVGDINLGWQGAYPVDITEANGSIYFRADDGDHGEELWRLDLATGVSKLVFDIYPGRRGSSPGAITAFNNHVYFMANDGARGSELWRSDGTATGTVLVKDISPGSTPWYTSGITVYDGSIYFAADDGVHGMELWKSDGTPAGTVMVKDVNPGAWDSRPTGFFGWNDQIFFVAGTGGIGDADLELWVSDGTETGTRRVKDINPGTGSAFNFYHREPLVAFGAAVYFAASNGTHGVELWRTDGTESGTYMVRDIHTGAIWGGPGSSAPAWLTPFDGSLYFAAEDDRHGRELWKTDGTAAGTVLVSDLVPGPSPSSPMELTEFNGSLFFSGGGDHFSAVADVELYCTNGTAESTRRIRDINTNRPPYYAQSGTAGSWPSLLTVAGGSLFFFADDGVHGRELWRSDGDEANTNLVQDIGPGNYSGITTLGVVTDINGSLFFAADNRSSGVELWRLDVAEQPVAVSDVFETREDGSLALPAAQLLGNDRDPMARPLIARLEGQAEHGHVSVEPGGVFVYVPVADFFGIDRFTYSASAGGELGNAAVVTVTVQPADDPPVARADMVRITPNFAPQLPAPGVLVNDHDVDGDPITAILVQDAAHGTVELAADGSLVYTVRDQSTARTDSFTYKTSDGRYESAPAEVTIVLNRRPVGTADGYTVLQDDGLHVAVADGLLRNDFDPDDDSLTAEIVQEPVNGYLFNVGNGAFSYIPAYGFHGTDTFSYRPNDGAATGTETVVAITVSPRPVGNNDSYRFLGTTVLRVAAPGLLGNDQSPSGRPLTARLLSGPGSGRLILNPDGSFEYRLDPGALGPDSFAYVATDGDYESHPTWVSVEAVRPAQARHDDFGEVRAGRTIDVPAPGLLQNDVNDFDANLTVRAVTQPRHGQLTLEPNGAFRYAAFDTFAGVDTFTYVVHNGFADSAPALVTLSSSVFVPLETSYDEFGVYYRTHGPWILTVQAFGDDSNPTFGFFDTGSAAVTFSAYDQRQFTDAGNGIPIQVPGGAHSQGIGGKAVGDVSMPGSILVDGLGAVIATDAEGLPVVDIRVGAHRLATSPLQVMIGTEAGSPYLPTITGTPVLRPTAQHPKGLAAQIAMDGVALDFTSLDPDAVVFTLPDIRFVSTDTELTATAGTTDPVTVPLAMVGGSNPSDASGKLSLDPVPLIQNVELEQNGRSIAGKPFLFDTGAQITVISTGVARSLGLDMEFPDLWTDIDGVAGMHSEVPGFVLDTLTLPTVDGRFVHFKQVPVFVLDTDPAVDGILGMNLFNTARELLYNPFATGGATLSMTFDTELTGPDVGTLIYPIDLMEAMGGGSFVGAVTGQKLPNIRFEQASRAAPSIRGSVFQDSNRNRRFDSLEFGLNGMAVYVDSNGNGRFNTAEPRTTTDSTGRFTFTGLAAGKHTVRIELPSGMKLTTPKSQHRVKLEASASAEIQFGLSSKRSKNAVRSIVVDRLHADAPQWPSEASRGQKDGQPDRPQLAWSESNPQRTIRNSIGREDRVDPERPDHSGDQAWQDAIDRAIEGLLAPAVNS